MSHSVYSFKAHSVTITLACLLSVSGCALTQQPPVAALNVSALSIKSVTDNPSPPISKAILESDVISALKCQIYKGLKKVDTLKTQTPYNLHPNVNDFNYKDGTGTFSGSVLSVETTNGKMNAIVPFVPFSGWLGSTHTPSIDGTLSSSATRLVKRSFDINTDLKESSSDVCNDLKDDKIDEGSFIYDAIVSAFTSTMRVAQRTSSSGVVTMVPYKPYFKLTANEITAAFTVVRKQEGGIAFSLVAAAPDLTSLGPSAKINSDKTGVYTITLNLPIKLADQQDARRLQYCVNNGDARLCIEAPYTATTLKALQNQLNKAAMEPLIEKSPSDKLPSLDDVTAKF